MAVQKDENETSSNEVAVVSENNNKSDVDTLIESHPIEGTVCKVIFRMTGGDLTEAERLEKLLTLSFDAESVIVIGDCENNLQESIETLVQRLKVGEHCSFDIPSIKDAALLTEHSELEAFPSNSGIFDVQLISFEKALNVNQLSSFDMFKRAKHYKEIGNQIFKKKNIELSFKKYSRALKYLIVISDSLLKENKDLDEEYKKLKSQLYLNMAACQLQHDGHSFAAENCTKTLKIEPTNVKALYRRGLAYKGMNEYEKAEIDFEKALEIDQSNNAVKKELSEIKSHMQNQNAKLAQAMGKMFCN